MKVVIGHDGSAGAAQAVALAAAMPWPPSSELHVARVGGDDDAGAELAAVAEALRGLDRTVSYALHPGRPATVLRELADRSGADLLVVGSRGLGRVPSMLLGSVSAELVEQARCSVLIARGVTAERLVIGTDGSPASTAIPRILCRWELFRGRSARVVGVVAGEVDRATALQTRRFAVRLGTCGVQTDDEVLSGDPAAKLIEAAGARSADLLVIGPRGRSRIGRLLLGSVARNVISHAGCSVLVVRSPRPTARTG